MHFQLLVSNSNFLVQYKIRLDSGIHVFRGEIGDGRTDLVQREKIEKLETHMRSTKKLTSVQM